MGGIRERRLSAAGARCRQNVSLRSILPRAWKAPGTPPRTCSSRSGTRRAVRSCARWTAGRPTSPRQISEKLDETLSNVSYHFRVLAESGVLEAGDDPAGARLDPALLRRSSIEAEWAQALLAVDEAGGRQPRRAIAQGEEIA